MEVGPPKHIFEINWDGTLCILLLKDGDLRSKTEGCWTLLRYPLSYRVGGVFNSADLPYFSGLENVMCWSDA